MILRLVVLVALTLGACRSKGPVEVADAFVHESYGWTQGLTTEGQSLGNSLYDVIEGKQTRGQVEQQRQAMVAKLRSKMRAIEAEKLPDIQALQAYRAELLDYLAFQVAMLDGAFAEALEVAGDSSRSADDRATAIAQRMTAVSVEEQQRADRVQERVDALYRVLRGS